MKHRAACIALAVAMLSRVPAAHGAPVEGISIDFAPQLPSSRHERALKGRAYLHPTVTREPQRPRPLVVFMHGLNHEQLAHRWMGGGGTDPDVREMLASLIESNTIGPSILVAPSIIDECDFPRSMWPGFDLDRFLALAIRAIGSRAAIDARRIILGGHSGAACNPSGGLILAVRSSVELRAVLAIDTCMDLVTAPLLALAPPETDVVIAWQPNGWNRPFEDFQRVFEREAEHRHARGLRLVEQVVIGVPNAHNAIVQASLTSWLPRWIPPEQSLSPTSPDKPKTH